MDTAIQNGYLVLADISGYTSFIAETELDHGPKILKDLITLIIDNLAPPLKLAEVEGDAVFVYAPAAALTRGELLLEVIETTYAAFHNRLRTMKHNATCPCKACRSFSNLNLKFITHYGSYILQDVAGKQKPVGTCVNMAHRLLKNNVVASTGWDGYALFSEASRHHMGIDPAGAHHEVESYEHLGEVATISTNLQARYEELVETHRDVLTEQAADVTLSCEFSVSPAVVWDWLSDPHKRSRWFEGSAWVPKERPEGRTSRAAKNHCANSGFIEHILDWRPFEYYTVRLRKGKLALKITGALQPSEGGTQYQWNMKLDNGLPVWLRRPLSRLLALGMRMGHNLQRMDALMAEAPTADMVLDEEPLLQ